jgi:hypothetical protein
LVITHKRAILARVYFNSDESKHPLIELEHVGHLHVYHPDQVQELNEYWTPLLILVVLVVVSESPRELMPERQPLLLDQLLKAPDCAVAAVE